MKTERIDFTAAPEALRRQIFEEAKGGWTEIFGTPPSDLENYWFETKSRQTYLYVLRDDDGELVGTFAAKYYDVRHAGRDIVIMKFGVGVLPGVRGRGFAVRCGARELLANLGQLLLRETYLFSTIIHPIVYHIACQWLDKYYPYHDRPQDTQLETLAKSLADYFGLQKAESASPYVYREARVSLETDKQRAALRARESSALEFYLRECPNYASGDCLTILTPFTARELVPIFARLSKVWLRRRLREARRRVTTAAVTSGRARASRRVQGRGGSRSRRTRYQGSR